MLTDPIVPPAMAEEFVRVRRLSSLRIEWRPEQIHARGSGLVWVGERALEGGLEWSCVAWFEGLCYPRASWQEPVKVAGSSIATSPMRAATEGALINLIASLGSVIGAARQRSADESQTSDERAAAAALGERATAASDVARALLDTMKTLWPSEDARGRDRVETVALLMRLPGSNLYRRSEPEPGEVGGPRLPCRRLAHGGEALAAAAQAARSMASSEVSGASLGRVWIVRAEWVGGGLAESVAVYEVLFGRLTPPLAARAGWLPPWEFGRWSKAAIERARLSA